MRYLKNKILKARRVANLVSATTSSSSSHREELFVQSPSSAEDPIHYTPPKIRRRSRDLSENCSSRPNNPTKNLAINYGKAISTFSMSTLAKPYLADYLEEQEISFKDFARYVSDKKEHIGSISDLRGLLLCTVEDSPKARAYKGAFKIASEVFIKYFSVNWIIHGKVANKLVYLKFRSKMLRRVQNPELFAYIRINDKKNKKNEKNSG